MALIRFKRGTRAELEAALAARELTQAEPYYITDDTDAPVAIGTGTDSYVDFNIGNWDAAFSWGDHGEEGYAVSGTAGSEVRTNTQLDGRYGRLGSFNTWTASQVFENNVRVHSTNGGAWFEIADDHDVAGFTRRAIIRATPNRTDQVQLRVYDSADGTFDSAPYTFDKDGTARFAALRLSGDTETITLGGDFDSGQQVKCTRVGDQVTITSLGGLDHNPQDSVVISDFGVIPEAYRPPNNMYQYYHSDINAGINRAVAVTTGGTLQIVIDQTGSTDVTNTATAFTITYNV